MEYHVEKVSSFTGSYTVDENITQNAFIIKRKQSTIINGSEVNYISYVKVNKSINLLQIKDSKITFNTKLLKNSPCSFFEKMPIA